MLYLALTLLIISQYLEIASLSVTMVEFQGRYNSQCLSFDLFNTALLMSDETFLKL